MMIKISENTLCGFVQEAQARGIPQTQIPYLLKVAGWLQAHQANPQVFEQGMAEAMAKHAARIPLRGKFRFRKPGAPARAPAAAPAAAAAAAGAGAAGLSAAGRAAPAAAAAGFRGIVPALVGAGKRGLEGLRYLAFGPKPGVAAGTGGGSVSGGLKTLGLLGAGGAATYGADKGLTALEGMTADQKMLDDIVNYRNQYADFVTKQTMLGSLPGLRAQPRLGGGWSQYQ